MTLNLTAAATLTLFTFTSAQASLVTDSGTIPGPQTIIDFSQFSGFNHGTDLDLGNGVNVTGNFYYGSFSYSLGFMLSATQNGYWYAPNTYIASGIDVGPSGDLTFTFTNGPVQGVGAFMNYYPGEGTPEIAAYDSNGNLLESWALPSAAPISTPSQENGGAFRGILRDQEDIASFTYKGGLEVLTDLTFTTSSQPSSVPVPGAMWLLGSGIMGLLAMRKKDK